MQKTLVTLRSLGLSEKEAQLYLLLLTLGSAPASVVGLRSGVPKSTARYLCLELAKKGLVRVTRKDSTFYYSPEPPQKIVARLERQREEIEHREEAAKRIVGELQAIMMPQSVLPKVEFYEGIEGLAQAYDRITNELQDGTEMLSFVRPIAAGEADALHPNVDPADVWKTLQRFVDERVRKNVKARVLACAMEEAEALRGRDIEELRETRIIATPSAIAVPGEIFIFNDSVCCMTAKNGVPFAYIVESPEAAAMHRAMFEMAWAAAPAAVQA